LAKADPATKANKTGTLNHNLVRVIEHLLTDASAFPPVGKSTDPEV